MDPLTLMTIGRVAGAVVPSIINFVSNQHNNQLQQDIHQQDQQWQQQMAAQANQWSIEQWNRENEYNSPQAQMERLKSAGINPALVYSNGLFNQSATSPDVQMPENGQRANTLPWQMDPMLLSNLETANAQRELMKSEAAKNDADAALAKSTIPLKEQEILNLKQQCEESVQRLNESAAKVSLMSEQEKTEIEKRATMHWNRLMKSRELDIEAQRVGAYVSGVKHDNKLKDAQAAQFRRETFEMVQTFAWRVYGLRLGNQLSESTLAESLYRFKKLGIILQPGDQYGPSESQVARFDITLDENSAAENFAKDGWVYTDLILKMIGQVLGGNVGLGFYPSYDFNRSNKRSIVGGFGKR